LTLCLFSFCFEERGSYPQFKSQSINTYWQANRDHSGEGDEELQTWLQDNLKDKVWDDGYGSVEAAESYMLEKTIKDKKEKADKTKDKKRMPKRNQKKRRQRTRTRTKIRRRRRADRGADQKPKRRKKPNEFAVTGG